MALNSASVLQSLQSDEHVVYPHPPAQRLQSDGLGAFTLEGVVGRGREETRRARNHRERTHDST